MRNYVSILLKDYVKLMYVKAFKILFANFSEYIFYMQEYKTILRKSKTRQTIKKTCHTRY